MRHDKTYRVISESSNYIKIEIPANVNDFTKAWILIGILVGIALIIRVFDELLSASGISIIFPLLFLSIISLFEILNLFILFWVIKGKESILVDNKYFFYEMKLLKFGIYNKKIEKSQISKVDLNIEKRGLSRFGVMPGYILGRFLEITGLIGGRIKLEYNSKETKFASNLNNQESSEILSLIKENLF